MKNNNLDFLFIEKEIRSKTFGILTTINSNGTPHTSGVLYGVSPTNSELHLYIITSKKSKKTRNIQKSPSVSFIIPFPHHFLHFAPSNTITINGKAEILSFNNADLVDIFYKKRILRMIVQNIDEKEKDDIIFIKIKPDPKILCYGVGINVLKLRNSHTEGGYSIIIPENRLEK